MNDNEMKRLRCHKAVGPDTKHCFNPFSLTRYNLTQLKSPKLLNHSDVNNSLFRQTVCVLVYEGQNEKTATQLLGTPLVTGDSEISLHLKHTLKVYDSTPGQNPSLQRQERKKQKQKEKKKKSCQ